MATSHCQMEYCSRVSRRGLAIVGVMLQCFFFFVLSSHEEGLRRQRRYSESETHWRILGESMFEALPMHTCTCIADINTTLF